MPKNDDYANSYKEIPEELEFQIKSNFILVIFRNLHSDILGNETRRIRN